MLSSGPSYQLSQLENVLASYFHRLLAICNITSMECHMHMHFVSCPGPIHKRRGLVSRARCHMGNYSVWPPRLGEGLVTHKNESLGPWYVLFSHISKVCWFAKLVPSTELILLPSRTTMWRLPYVISRGQTRETIPYATSYMHSASLASPD